jgi:hypothetical protein
MLLTKLGIRKQAKLDKEDYLVFAEDLERFDLEDIAKGLEELGMTPREKGQPAFPETALVVAAVSRVRYKRLSAIAELRREEERKAEYIRRAEQQKLEWQSQGYVVPDDPDERRKFEEERQKEWWAGMQRRFGKVAVTPEPATSAAAEVAAESAAPKDDLFA